MKVSTTNILQDECEGGKTDIPPGRYTSQLIALELQDKLIDLSYGHRQGEKATGKMLVRSEHGRGND